MPKSDKAIDVVQPGMSELEEVIAVEQAAWPDIGDDMQADYEKFATRIENELMYLLYLEGEPAGHISFQNPDFVDVQTMQSLQALYEQTATNSPLVKPTYRDKQLHDLHNKETRRSQHLLEWERLRSSFSLPPDWYAATNDGYIEQDGHSTHDPSSDVMFLIGVGVDASLTGNGLVNHLISHTLEQAQQEGVEFALGYGRLPQLHESHSDPSIVEAEEHLRKRKKGTSLPFDYGARFHARNGAESVAVIPDAMDDPESCNYGFLAVYDL